MRGNATHLPTDGEMTSRDRRPKNSAGAYGTATPDISVFFGRMKSPCAAALIALRPVNDIAGVVRVSPQ
jgi:hypothetical protein